jgi:hypothetical protein
VQSFFRRFPSRRKGRRRCEAVVLPASKSDASALVQRSSRATVKEFDGCSVAVVSCSPFGARRKRKTSRLFLFSRSFDCRDFTEEHSGDLFLLGRRRSRSVPFIRPPTLKTVWSQSFGFSRVPRLFSVLLLLLPARLSTLSLSPPFSLAEWPSSLPSSLSPLQLSTQSTCPLPLSLSTPLDSTNARLNHLH